MFNKVKNWFKKPQAVPTPAPVAVEQPQPKVAKAKPKKPRKQQAKKVETPLTEKERATEAGEPYVSILKVEVDPSNINAGSFELDWNDKFVINLIRAGYKIREDDTDNDIVDRWFQTVCRNIALEVYEQQDADLTEKTADLRQIKRRNLGNGRSEIS
jgi:hypothetical protein